MSLMSQQVHHPMRAEWSEDRRTMRYHCLVCERCVEDGPEGLRVLACGDTVASHGGGVLVSDAQVETGFDGPDRGPASSGPSGLLH